MSEGESAGAVKTQDSPGLESQVAQGQAPSADDVRTPPAIPVADDEVGKRSSEAY